jgi:hypothetical protein
MAFWGGFVFKTTDIQILSGTDLLEFQLFRYQAKRLYEFLNCFKFLQNWVRTPYQLVYLNMYVGCFSNSFDV